MNTTQHQEKATCPGVGDNRCCGSRCACQWGHRRCRRTQCCRPGGDLGGSRRHRTAWSRHRARRPVERHIVYGAGVQHSGHVVPGGPVQLSGLVVPGGPVLAGERMGRCGRLTVATGVDGAKLDTGFYLRECLFPRLDSALKRRNVSQVEVDIRCCRGPFKAECAPRLCRRRRRRAPNPCVALPR